MNQKGFILVFTLVVILALGLGIASILILRGNFYASSTDDSSVNVVHSPVPNESPDLGWKTYKNDKYGLEFSYPIYFKISEDEKYPLLQIQGVENDEVTSIAGSITVLDSQDSRYFVYKKMYGTTSKCPEAVGEINMGDTVSVYCSTGKTVPLDSNSISWKGVVECAASQFYGLKVDPETCPHQFWIQTDKYFYIAHFNYFEPITERSETAKLLTQILSTFRFMK